MNCTAMNATFFTAVPNRNGPCNHMFQDGDATWKHLLSSTKWFKLDALEGKRVCCFICLPIMEVLTVILREKSCHHHGFERWELPEWLLRRNEGDTGRLTWCSDGCHDKKMQH